MLENVTIIIPEHNRPERLQRLLDYYDCTGATILVPDSSDKPYTGTYNASTTTYMHLPGMHFLLKLRKVLPLIKPLIRCIVPMMTLLCLRASPP